MRGVETRNGKGYLGWTRKILHPFLLFLAKKPGGRIAKGFLARVPGNGSSVAWAAILYRAAEPASPGEAEGKTNGAWEEVAAYCRSRSSTLTFVEQAEDPASVAVASSEAASPEDGNERLSHVAWQATAVSCACPAALNE